MSSSQRICTVLKDQNAYSPSQNASRTSRKYPHQSSKLRADAGDRVASPACMDPQQWKDRMMYYVSEIPSMGGFLQTFGSVAEVEDAMKLSK